MKKVKRIYLMPEVWGTVSNSQVFNWIKLIDQFGISTDCISLSKKSLDQNRVAEIERETGVKFYQFKPYYMIINDVFLTILLLIFYFKYVLRYDRVIFQTRVPTIAFGFTIVGLMPKSEIIFEARGASVEERNYSDLNNKKKRSKLKYRIAQRYLEFNEKWFIKYSSKVICVSHTLKEYYVNKYKLKSRNKFFVFHGAADDDLFYFSSDLRDKERRNLGLKKESVLVIYSGALRKKWEIPDVVIGFMKSFIEKDDRIVFLMLTPDLDIAKSMVKESGIEDRVKIMQSGFQEVNRFLNAADFGLLLRDDVIMNKVASPTKFAEYLNAGLPVIMSKGVEDYAKLIEETGFGVVLTNYHKLMDEDYQKFLTREGLDRRIISTYGKEKLSKRAALDRYRNLFFED